MLNVPRPNLEKDKTVRKSKRKLISSPPPRDKAPIHRSKVPSANIENAVLKKWMDQSKSRTFGQDRSREWSGMSGLANKS